MCKFTNKSLIFHVSYHFPDTMPRFNVVQNHSIPLKGLGGFANKSEDEEEDDVLHDRKTTMVVATSVSNFKGNDPLTSMSSFGKK
jgi:hypothetical protein